MINTPLNDGLPLNEHQSATTASSVCGANFNYHRRIESIPPNRESHVDYQLGGDDSRHRRQISSMPPNLMSQGDPRFGGAHKFGGADSHCHR